MAVSGGYLALHLALKRAVDGGALRSLPLTDSVAAVSVGVVGGMPVVDLEYEEDCVAEVDMNVVMTGNGPLHRGAGDGGEPSPSSASVLRRSCSTWPSRASAGSRRRRWSGHPGRTAQRAGGCARP